ncbi:DNA helicase PcrA [Hathewaya histolytica]|uniref:ATP-dependent DNA helicase n=1 Tax=Hathewaya histolytica TaxID=1498 RepID=A0A4V6KC62_HATHI|nr:DNA helicase PcrA [Hathewaya histolytica]VTQ85167.1 ATP-dependent DNA helicase PcrA [Hathewaya histolytica]
MDLKNLLNEEQYEAATTVKGPLLILAGAGSGKTRVLTYRIAHMIEDLDIKPYEILAITFTNKAAGEMRERVKRLVGDQVDSMWISTFHSSCVRILRREIDKLGYNKNFTIYDTYDQKTLIKQCMTELNINDKDITDREIINKISDCKNNMQSAESYKKENEGDFRKNKIADMYLLYQKKLKANNALDFDDLIFKTVQLFKQHEDVLEFYQRKFKYILVDEYQDTNEAQYELVKLLAKAHDNICVVGDDDQCIYEWRGANIKNILGFEKDFPSAKVVKLEKNYRSKGTILDAANSVIKNNAQRKNKVLKSTKDGGEKVRLYRAFTDRDEASFIVNEIKKIKSSTDKSYKDFAILYRMNSQSRIFEEALRREGVPYRILGGLKFYDRKEIKDIMAYLKLINNPLDDVSLQRIINVPKRSIGDTTVSKVLEFSTSTGECLYSTLLDAGFVPGLTARNVTCISKFTSLINEFMTLKNQVNVSGLIKEILDKTGYLRDLEKSKEIEDKSRIENLKELVSEAVEFERNSEDKSLGAFLEKVTLVADVDNYDEDADSIVLMTIHSSKGLEFPVVFMVGMENGLFPSETSLNSYTEMEESRRLCYVAITRAQELLYMTSAQSRMVFGRTVCYSASDFIDEIPLGLKENVSGSRGVNVLKSNTNSRGLYGSRTPSLNNNKPMNKASKVDPSGVVLGRKVKHTSFGEGTIVGINKSEKETLITIAFNNAGIKKLILEMAPLELL